MKTFFDYMMVFQGDDSPEGDLADDMYLYKEWYKKNLTGDLKHDKAAILSHLYNHNACSACIELFKQCWRDYKHKLSGVKA